MCFDRNCGLLWSTYQGAMEKSKFKNKRRKSVCNTEYGWLIWDYRWLIWMSFTLACLLIQAISFSNVAVISFSSHLKWSDHQELNRYQLSSSNHPWLPPLQAEQEALMPAVSSVWQWVSLGYQPPTWSSQIWNMWLSNVLNLLLFNWKKHLE